MVIFNSYVKLPEGIHWLIFVPATRITHYVDLYILVCWFVGHAWEWLSLCESLKFKALSPVKLLQPCAEVITWSQFSNVIILMYIVAKLQSPAHGRFLPVTGQGAQCCPCLDWRADPCGEVCCKHCQSKEWSSQGGPTEVGSLSSLEGRGEERDIVVVICCNWHCFWPQQWWSMMIRRLAK